MRRLVLVVCALAVVITTCEALADKITIDPNAPGSPVAQEPLPEDPRLDQTITYQVKLRPIADLTDDLTKLTGVTFYAGSLKSDWRVREDCCTVMAKDVTLRQIMGSIAQVMKFRWSKAGTAPNWTYRLVEDKSAIAKVLRAEQARKERDRSARVARLGELRSVAGMSAEQLAKLREDDPALYLLAGNGQLGHVLALLDRAPLVRDAWINGQDLKANGAWLPPDARSAAVACYSAAVCDAVRQHPSDPVPDIARDVQEQSSRIRVEVGKPETWMPYGSLDISWGVIGPLAISLEPPRTESRRLMETAYLRATEEMRPFPDIYREMKDDIQAARMRERDSAPPRLDSYTQETLLDHSNEPEFGEPLNDKIEAETVTGLIESISAKTGLAVVTDDFRGRISTTLDKDTALKSLFDDVAKLKGRRNWRHEGGVVEMWDTNWYDSRNARVSKVWLEELRHKFQQNGTLDLDDLAQIAALTDEQYRRNILDDPILKYASYTIGFTSSRRQFLKLYASLSQLQKFSIFGESGLGFHELNPQQQASVISLASGLSLSHIDTLDLASLGARVFGTREVDNGRFSYAFGTILRGVEIPGRYRFRTPRYTAPPQPPPSKPADLPTS